MSDCKKESNFKRIIKHEKILNRPLQRPEGTTGSVGYELGKCFQLDKTHCLLVASMDEQGGGDLCVGNDAFIFSKLSDIRPEDAIALNRPDPQYKLKSQEGTSFLAKYPATGGFVPLGAKTKTGQPINGEGTGLLISTGLTFNEDSNSVEEDSELIIEFMQLKWDGCSISVTKREMCDNLLGHKLLGPPLSYFYLDGETLLAPLLTPEGIVVFRFEFDGNQWSAVECGEPFMTCHNSILGSLLPGEAEPSIVKQDDKYLIYTRGNDPKGRVYSSSDGLNFQLSFEKDNHTVPQALNMGLDGSFYLTTNPPTGMLRNPLIAYPMLDGCFGEAVIIHDEDGIRDDKGDKIPFIDHAVGVNLYLEGRWRHLLWYRVCDLKERSLYSFQEELNQEIHGNDGPRERSETGGLYLVEIEYDQVTNIPFNW